MYFEEYLHLLGINDQENMVKTGIFDNYLNKFVTGTAIIIKTLSLTGA